FILLIGILIFSFYQYNRGPVYFDEVGVAQAKQTIKKDSLNMLEAQYSTAFAAGNMKEANAVRKTFKGVMERALPGEKPNDTNYIFLWFVKENLPVGLIGLIFAIIFLAAWGSIAAALNSLAACSVVDFHKKFFVKKETELEDYKVSQWYTLGWGVFCIIISMFAYNIGNSLIEAVNILGSLFYGVILGIFLVAFGIRFIKGHAVFYAAIISELLIILIYKMDVISFLWLNAIGAILVIGLSAILQLFIKQRTLQ
ncbi:MAG: sodium:solute symporter, partial [Ferruginibacter sp.]|nr:sodium:solute symporter [Ferruginibacter sp.]